MSRAFLVVTVDGEPMAIMPDGAPGRLLDLILFGELQILYDDRILAEYNANMLVTGNRRHFAGLEVHSVGVLSPDAFLELLR